MPSRIVSARPLGSITHSIVSLPQDEQNDFIDDDDDEEVGLPGRGVLGLARAAHIQPDREPTKGAVAVAAQRE